jgi:hypothetical protein
MLNLKANYWRDSICHWLNLTIHKQFIRPHNLLGCQFLKFIVLNERTMLEE